MKQLNSLDYLKAYAIIAVLFLHLLPYNYLIKTFAQFHIWQAVPIFVLLMGYTFTLSFNKVSFETINWFLYFSKKIKRIVFPVIVINSILFFLDLVLKKELIQWNFLFNIIPLYQGSGTYFILIAIESIFVLPIIYYLHRYMDNTKLFLLIMFFLNILIEFIALNNAFLNNSFNHSANILRFVFLIALGMYLYSNEDKNEKLFKLLSLFSFFYLLIWGILKFDTPFVVNSKSWQNYFSYLYTYIFVYYFFKILENYKERIQILILIGKASWHIFLIQVAYFGMDLKRIFFEFISSYISNYMLNGLITIIFSITIILYIGILWYKFEKRLLFDN